MRIEEETIIIKDGRSLTLRSAAEKDAETMLDYIRKWDSKRWGET